MDFFGQHLTRQTYGPSQDTDPAWSPECAGSTPNSALGTIAFQSDRAGNWDIFLLDLGANERPFQVTTDPGNDTDPSWAPDGSTLAFQSDRGGNWDIFTIRRGGTNKVQRTDGPADEINPVWSPDGSAIVYASNRSGDWDLYMLDLDGDQEIQLTSGTGNDLLPTWSPDGDRVAFQSNWDGDWEIYVYDAISNTLLRLTDNPADDEAPSWNCGGNRVLFHSDRDGDAEIYSIALSDPTDVIQLTDQNSAEQDVVWQPVSRNGSLVLKDIPVGQRIVPEEKAPTVTPRPIAIATPIPSTPAPRSLTGTIAERLGSNWAIPAVVSVLLLVGLGVLWLISARRDS
jgi:Tol biopolymer transport system component